MKRRLGGRRGGEQGAHVAPDAPRGIQEWDGRQWTQTGVFRRP
ncbi:DUF6087 family protein [Streptomyces sp. NBC_01538]